LGQLEAEGVFTPAAADDEDFHEVQRRNWGFGGADDRSRRGK
jgi:hypothetical protein